MRSPEIQKSVRWETQDRFYLAVLGEDLFGNLEVRQYWGGLRNGRGGSQVQSVSGLNEGMAILEQIAKTRKRHGYTQISA